MARIILAELVESGEPHPIELAIEAAGAHVVMDVCAEGVPGSVIRLRLAGDQAVAASLVLQRYAAIALREPSEDMRSDGLIHLRKEPSSPTVAPAWCGKRGQATILDASGYHGPEGNGWDSVCKPCVAAQKAGVR